MQLPNITTKQQTILRLLYRFRFLDRTHIQALLRHKDKKTINAWLRDLVAKQYIVRIYDGQAFAEKIKPAIYYLGLNGMRYMRAWDEFPPAELRKRYHESTRTQDFIDRNLLLAGCCIDLMVHATTGVQYAYMTQADYADPAGDYWYLTECKPHLLVTKVEGNNTSTYLLEVFTVTTPRYMVKKRLKDYVAFLEADEWREHTGDTAPPAVLFVCPTVAELLYIKRYTRMILEDAASDVCVRLTTTEKLEAEGITGEIWEAVSVATR